MALDEVAEEIFSRFKGYIDALKSVFNCLKIKNDD